ncbi:sigma-70 family RNA polymerase sigma factor [Acanthopleuribacter pedis]|uniref:Sigma-70 family RNA polymerase sigma factor n=1 Tax=Acanthopleuribacter pedis TaxID=442870 RepID=A0A8J7Q910_9BACT|nr:sigma-70 family RNA polymerase sigma factor [Acanthopleuribacter pedis]MBO1319659.1 sigma-70 family RNA polymerase sigma factor [Acanthopleuribacter pedis]
MNEPLPPPSSEVTRLIREWSDGSKEALEQLMPIVFDELHRLARIRFLDERKSHTLQPTALVSELYLRFTGETNINLHDRAHFFGVAARRMRQILVDHARKTRAQKRGHGKTTLSLEVFGEIGDKSSKKVVDVIALDQALTKFAEIDPRKCRIVELRFFAGLTIQEAADMIGISLRTAKREWTIAKAWLFNELKHIDDSRAEPPSSQKKANETET